MLRRVISAIVLASLAAAPVVARTRFFCRYSGVEITDCAEQQVPIAPEVRPEGCCDRQLTPAAGAFLAPSHEQIQPPLVAVLLAPAAVEDVLWPALARPFVARPASSGPPVYLITRALLI